MTLHTHHEHQQGHCGTAHCWSHISWSAIFVGAIASIGLSFLFNSFNLGVGLSAFRQGATTGLAAGGFVWLIICAIISMFIVGLIAGWIASFRCAKTSNGILHGFLAWCGGLILMLILIAHMGMLTTNNEQFLSFMRLNPNVPQGAVNMATVAIVAFVIFIIGAIASCIGGWVGVHCKCSHHDHGATTTTTEIH